MNTLKQHPLSAAFPAMQDAEFQALKDSVDIVGVQNPITLFDGLVIDGWHRYCAAIDLGMHCPTVELDDDVDPVDFVKAQNGARRNMTPSQTAFAYTQLYLWKQVGWNQHASGSAVTADPPKTTKELAAMAGVGTRTIEQAKAVHSCAVPAIQNAVKAGAISVETASYVAKLPVSDQVKIAAKGPSAMRMAAKPAAKVALRSGTSAKTTTQVKLTQAQAEAAQRAEDAHGDADPVAMLEEAEKQNTILSIELAAMQADDQKAETLKWRRIADVATRRQNELMDTVNVREKELKRMMNLLRRISNAVGEEDIRKIPAIVEAKFRPQEVAA